jgi:ABC-type transport system involved in multi-copper enzyme maturation permease subunit
VNATIAAQMTGADLLKLRKKRGTVIWALVLAALPVIIFFTVKAVQHSSNSMEHGPAGGIHGFEDGLRLLALLMGPLAAVLIGAEAGASDSTAGVFRDLVVTGRSRLALFATRVPAALAVCWSVVLAGYALVLLATFVFAGGQPTPDGALIAEGLGFAFLAAGVVCAVAVGFAALTNSRAASITALIGWQLILSPILASIGELGSARKLLLEQGIVHFRPLNVHDHAGIVNMSTATALVVMLAWLAIFLALGAWRTRTMDA